MKSILCAATLAVASIAQAQPGVIPPIDQAARSGQAAEDAEGRAFDTAELLAAVRHQDKTIRSQAIRRLVESADIDADVIVNAILADGSPTRRSRRDFVHSMNAQQHAAVVAAVVFMSRVITDVSNAQDAYDAPTERLDRCVTWLEDNAAAERAPRGRSTPGRAESGWRWYLVANMFDKVLDIIAVHRGETAMDDAALRKRVRHAAAHAVADSSQPMKQYAAMQLLCQSTIDMWEDDTELAAARSAVLAVLAGNRRDRFTGIYFNLSDLRDHNHVGYTNGIGLYAYERSSTSNEPELQISLFQDNDHAFLTEELMTLETLRKLGMPLAEVAGDARAGRAVRSLVFAEDPVVQSAAIVQVFRFKQGPEWLKQEFDRLAKSPSRRTIRWLAARLSFLLDEDASLVEMFVESHGSWAKNLQQAESTEDDDRRDEQRILAQMHEDVRKVLLGLCQSSQLAIQPTLQLADSRDLQARELAVEALRFWNDNQDGLSEPVVEQITDAIDRHDRFRELLRDEDDDNAEQ